MNEFDAMKQIDQILNKLKNEDEIERVVRWVASKHSIQVKHQPSNIVDEIKYEEDVDNLKEIPGIAKLDDSGKFHLTIRDVKAKNTNDAAIRIALVSIYAYQKFTSENLSSRKILKPILEDWRAYTGNTRAAIASHKGIIRNGDELSLDKHAEKDAENYIKEILDEKVNGSWEPRDHSRKKKVKNKQ